MPQRPVEEIARDLAGRAACELGLSAAREKRLADALAEALAVERGRADEFERVFTKATGDAAGILWEDDPEATYTAGPDGPSLVALHFKKQRDEALEELAAARTRCEELEKALRRLLESSFDNCYGSDRDKRWICHDCEGMAECIEDIKHTPDCVIVQARKAIDAAETPASEAEK